MTEYGSLIKPVDDCECGDAKCAKVGTLKSPDRNGKRHVKGCVCIACRNRNNRKRGLSKQAAAAKRIGLATAKFLPSDEEAFAGAFRWEHKATKAEAGPVWTAYRKVEAQSEAARPIGDHRPFLAVFTAPGENKDGLVVVRQSKLLEVAVAVIEQAKETPA